MNKLKLVVVLAALLGASQAFALGIGAPQVRSYLGEPLDVTAPLILKPGEVAKLDDGSVRVGDRALFKQLQLPYQSIHGQLQVSIKKEGNKAYVLLATRRAFVEPLIELPLDIRLGGSRLIRVVTLLVDPPSNRVVSQQPAAEAVPADTASGQISTSDASPRSETAAGSPDTRRKVVARMPSEPQRYNGSYGPVALNQTLGDIAQEIGYEEASLYQNLIALWEANPGAFLHNNMNHLKAGSTLRIPSRERTLGYQTAAAKREVLAQYRGKSGAPAVAERPDAGVASSEPVEPSGAEQQSVAQSPETEQKPRLTLTAPLSRKEISPELREEFNSLYVALEETETENRELRERIELLEKQVAAMSEMLLTDARDKLETWEQNAPQPQGGEPITRPATATPEAVEGAEEASEPSTPAPVVPPVADADGAGNADSATEGEEQKPALARIEGQAASGAEQRGGSSITLYLGVIAVIVVALLVGIGLWLLGRRRQWHHYQQLFKEF